MSNVVTDQPKYAYITAYGQEQFLFDPCCECGFRHNLNERCQFGPQVLDWTEVYYDPYEDIDEAYD